MDYMTPSYVIRTIKPNHGLFLISDRVDQLKDIIMGKTEAFSYLQKRSDYQKKGIVCECCYNQCSILELQQYCNSSPGKRNYRLADRGDD